MRLSDLLYSRVVDEDGNQLGKVADVRLVQDGPPLAGLDHSFRVAGLVVGHRGVFTRLGLTRLTVHGPWLLTVVAHRLARDTPYLPWSQVVSHTDTEVRVRGPLQEMPSDDPPFTTRNGSDS